jgi:hypothetical protein
MKDAHVRPSNVGVCSSVISGQLLQVVSLRLIALLQESSASTNLVAAPSH